MRSILVTGTLITFQVHTKTVQEFPDPSFRVLVIIITPSAAEGGSGFETTLVTLIHMTSAKTSYGSEYCRPFSR